MGSGSEIDVGRVIDDAKLNKVSVTVIVLCGLIMLMDGYDYGIISVAAPMIRKEWNVGTEAFGTAVSSVPASFPPGLSSSTSPIPLKA